MTYVKFNPSLMHQDLNKLVQEFMGVTEPARNSFHPPVNIYSLEGSIELELQVPGFKKEDISILLEKGLLTVQGKINKPDEASAIKWIRNEFKTDSFKRTFTLEDTIDVDNIEANYENGLLRISLNKKQPETPISKHIQIK